MLAFRQKYCPLFIICFTFAITLASPAFAADIPSGETAGSLHSRFQDETEDLKDSQGGTEQFMIEEKPLPQVIQNLQPPQAETSAIIALKDEAMAAEADKPKSSGWFSKVRGKWRGVLAKMPWRKKTTATAATEVISEDEETGQAQFMIERMPLAPPPPAMKIIKPPAQILAPSVKSFPPAGPTPVTPAAAPSQLSGPKTTFQPMVPKMVSPPAAATPSQGVRLVPKVLPPTPEPKITAPVVPPAVVPVTPAPVTPPASVEPSTPVTPESIPLPKYKGIHMISPLEDQMWEAARNRDFEKAIEIREQINALKETDSRYSDIIQLEKDMVQAARELDFEKAIEIREQIREIQTEIAIPAPLPPKPEAVFQIQGVRIKGNNAIPTEELLAFTKDLINTDITLSQVRDTAREIKQYYRQKGYIAAYVYIPPQELQDGYLEMELIEGKIGNIAVSGNRYFKDELIINRFHVPAGETVTYQMLQGPLQQLNDHRDIQARAVFQPGSQPGTTDLLLDIEDDFPIHATVDYNNYGTRLTGEDRYGVTLVHTNVLGNMDELFARFQFSEGTTGYAADYNTPFLSPDFRVGFAFSHGDSDLMGDFKALNAEGLATTYSGYAKMPLYYSTALAADLRVGFDHKRIENRLLDTSIGADELRMISTALELEETDQWGKTFWPHLLHFGVDAFGASPKNSETLMRANTGAPFMIYRSEIDRYHYLPNDMAARFHGAWQLTPDKLPSSEQFQIGGINTVRGYPQGEYSGDYGAVVSAEISMPLYFMPKDARVPFTEDSLYDSTRLVGFFDYGTANLKAALPGEMGKKDIAGAGVGLRMRLNDTWTGQLMWGFPLAETPSDSSDSSFYFGVSMDLI